MEQNKFYQIKNITEKEYTLVGCDGSVITRPIQDVDRLASDFTIQDAKDGDVLCCKSGWMCIFKAINNHTNTFSSYCFMDRYKWFCNRGSECHILDKEFIKSYNAELYPATKEQRDLLFQKMKEAGYEWNSKTKTLEKSVKPKFDPKTLNPFDKVLVKMNNESFNIWYGDFVAEPSHAKNETPLILGAKEANIVIPYNEETKHLVGTSEEAPEYYRYWED